MAVKSDVQDEAHAEEIGNAITKIRAGFPISCLRPRQDFKAKDLAELMERSRGLVIVWGDVNWSWVADELEKFNAFARQGSKVGAVALYDPVPKQLDINSQDIRTINCSSDADPSSQHAEIAEFVQELRQLMQNGKNARP